MILGMGVDLGDITFFANALEDKRSVFLEKTFTPQELATSRAGSTPTAHRLAARFAAKEAFYKALSQAEENSPQEKLPWEPLEIEVKLNSRGCPSICLYEETENIARKAGVRKIWLSLSHERDMALATVILEG